MCFYNPIRVPIDNTTALIDTKSLNLKRANCRLILTLDTEDLCSVFSYIQSVLIAIFYSHRTKQFLLSRGCTMSSITHPLTV
jgi:hypothetical protein